MLEAHRALHQLFDRKLVVLEDEVLHVPDCDSLAGFLEPPASPTAPTVSRP
jgi:hypothetical protein